MSTDGEAMSIRWGFFKRSTINSRPDENGYMGRGILGGGGGHEYDIIQWPTEPSASVSTEDRWFVLGLGLGQELTPRPRPK
jgi:hypothetical protein